MGFRTLAIEQRSSEVWQVLGAVKTEITKFGDAFEKVRRKLGEATKQLDQMDTRKRVLIRTLRDVDSVPGPQAQQLLGVADLIASDDDEDDGAALHAAE